MNTDKKVELVKEVGEEIITEEELRTLFETKKNIIAYDGFEPSGNIHIAQGIMRTININKLIKAGVRFKMLVADWHAWANNKMGGDLDKIQTVGHYLIEVWKASGMDLNKVDFVWANELVSDNEYWKKVMKIALNNTISRIVRCSQIMGRGEKEILSTSQVFYPCMQAADIFHLKADICQLGMDQRKVNMLAREIGPKMGYWKPVVVSHHMLMGLTKPPAGSLKTGDKIVDLKMSKSKPESAIFMTDTEEQINYKMQKAYCPEKVVEDNPVIDYNKHIIFEKFNTLKIERQTRFGGDIEVHSFDELKAMYASGKLHPEDLKKATAHYLNETIEPVRNYFEKNRKARELLEEVKSFKITR